MTGPFRRDDEGVGHASRRGLTIIEVLVALTLLSVIAASIVGAFSLLATLNRGSAAEVDVGRAVRTISEKIINDWKTPSEWESASVGGFTFDAYVAEVSARGDGQPPFCTGAFDPPATNVAAPVRTVVITCDRDQDVQSTFIFQVGSPL